MSYRVKMGYRDVTLGEYGLSLNPQFSKAHSNPSNSFYAIATLSRPPEKSKWLWFTDIFKGYIGLA